MADDDSVARRNFLRIIVDVLLSDSRYDEFDVVFRRTGVIHGRPDSPSLVCISLVRWPADASGIEEYVEWDIREIVHPENQNPKSQRSLAASRIEEAVYSMDDLEDEQKVKP